MALKDLFKKKNNKAKMQVAPTFAGNYPFYSSFGDNIYASDIIVEAIRCKANEFKKLQPRHIRTTDGIQTTITDSSIARVLKRPNDYMTTADFLEKITILLELNKNVFIYPEYYINKAGERVYTALYPLKPAEVEYLANEKNQLFIYLGFANGSNVTLPVEDVIHWRKDYGVNDYFGGGMFGGNDNRGLLTMLARYDQLTQSIAKALECSCQINGIVKYNSYLDDEKMETKRQQFENDVRANKSGVLFTDLKTEYQNIPRDVKLVDAETLKFFYETISRATGTPICILNGDYTKAQKEAWYEHSLEGDIISLGQAVSKTIFSNREQSFGNEINFYPNKIQFMSMENIISALQIGVPAGLFVKDEARELLGYAPLPNGQGQVIAQGYNNLLDENNNNKLSQNENGGANEQE